MTWAELGEVISSMSETEKNKTAVVFDWDSEEGWFYPISGCTEYDMDDAGVDFSCDIHSRYERW